MQGFIRKRSDFSIRLVNVLSYNVLLNSITKGKSTVTIDYNSWIAQGDFIVFDEYAGAIDSIALKNNVMELTCISLDDVFSRPYYWAFTFDGNSRTKGTIYTILLMGYKLGDPFYSMPYIDMDNPAMTGGFVNPNKDKDGFIILSDYLRLARRFGVDTQYNLKGDTLRIDIIDTPATTAQIDLEYTISETYGGFSTAKLTNYVEGVPTNYFLLSDGSITTDINDPNRVYGKWVVKAGVKTDDIPKEFAVTYGHEIEFRSAKKYTFHQPCIIRTPQGRIVSSFISSIRKTSNDNQYTYTAGELVTRATAKIRS